jgi:hypothetical protein
MYFYDFILSEINADNIVTCMFIISSIATMLQFLLTNLKLMKDFLMQYAIQSGSGFDLGRKSGSDRIHNTGRKL